MSTNLEWTRERSDTRDLGWPEAHLRVRRDRDRTHWRLERRKRRQRGRVNNADLRPQEDAGPENAPAAHRRRQETERGRHSAGTASGKRCSVFSQRVRPVRRSVRYRPSARRAAAIAITLATSTRGTLRTPSRQP